MTNNFISGRNAVLESLSNKRLSAEGLLVADSASGERIDEAKAEASRRDIPVKISNTHKLDDLDGTSNHQGVVLEVNQIHPYELEDILEENSGKAHGRLLVLDQVQDPVNLGKLARSALYFGFSGLIKTKDRSAPLSSTVIQSSAGAAARLPIAQVKNLQRGLDSIREARYWLVGLGTETDNTLEAVPRDRSLAVIVGHEGSGLRRLTREECDYLVKIRGSGQFDSLNVATAGAIAAYGLQPDKPDSD